MVAVRRRHAGRGSEEGQIEHDRALVPSVGMAGPKASSNRSTKCPMLGAGVRALQTFIAPVASPPRGECGRHPAF
jgi:hypothetical protein